MKKILLLILLMMSSFAQAQKVEGNDTYACVYWAAQGDETFVAGFEVEVGGGSVSLNGTIGGQVHSFDFIISNLETNNQFSYMERLPRANNGWDIVTSQFYVRFSKGEPKFIAGSAICSDNSSCWKIDCSLKQ